MSAVLETVQPPVKLPLWVVVYKVGGRPGAEIKGRIVIAAPTRYKVAKLVYTTLGHWVEILAVTAR